MPVLLLVTVTMAAACGRSSAPDTPPVTLTEGRVGDEAWRLEGRRLDGRPCASLFLVGADKPAASRCGIERDDVRHLKPVLAIFASRLFVFSAVPARARRVRVDGPDGSIRIEPAREAAGFPARFFVIDVDPADRPSDVLVFGDGGRAVVT